jgi:hypothetical protein
MTHSAYASPATSRATATVIRHPVAISLVVVVGALFWATVGFASSLFTNDIVVADGSYGLIRASIVGPAVLLLLCAGAWVGGLWRSGGNG